MAAAESDRDSVHDEDEEWRSLQEGVKDKRWYEGANRESFPVHAPHFPEVCVWLFVISLVHYSAVVADYVCHYSQLPGKARMLVVVRRGEASEEDDCSSSESGWPER